MSNENAYSLNALPDRNVRGAFSIFCDDVREESSGKLIHVGVYSQDVFVQAFPALLPTLTIMTWVWTALDRPFGKLVFRSLIDDQVLTTEEINPVLPEEGVPESPTTNGEQDSIAIRQYYTRIIRFSPFVVERESILRVRIETEDGEMRTGALRFKLSPQGG